MDCLIYSSEKAHKANMILTPISQMSKPLLIKGPISVHYNSKYFRRDLLHVEFTTNERHSPTYRLLAFLLKVDVHGCTNDSAKRIRKLHSVTPNPRI